MSQPSLEPVLHSVLGALMILTGSAACALSARRSIHYFQLESYQFQGYFRTLSRQWDKAAEPGLRLSAAALAVSAALAALQAAAGPSAADAWILLAAVILNAALLYCAVRILKSQRKAPEKKPFTVTARVKRLYAALFLVLCGLYAALWFLVCAGRGSLLYTAVFSLIPLGLPALDGLGRCPGLAG